VYTRSPFRKFCYYSSQNTVCIHVVRLENSAIIRHKILCVYMYCVNKRQLFIRSFCGFMYLLPKSQLLFVSSSIFTCGVLTELCY